MKHMCSWNRTKHQRYLKEGRGSGEGADYQPWIRVYDFSSKGTVSRVCGWKTHRIHHLMSNLELVYFYQLEWNDNVLDIREQYPLLDLQKTLKIAENMGVKHPYDTKSEYPYVLTTDFLITAKNGIFARTLKLSKELENKRVVEKLEIERRYWMSIGVDWKIVTEYEINWQKARNVEWVHNSLNIYLYDCLFDAIEKIQFCYENTNNSIYSICSDVDYEYGFEAGTGLSLFKFLVANKKVDIDMDSPLNIANVRKDQCEVLAV